MGGLLSRIGGGDGSIHQISSLEYLQGKEHSIALHWAAHQSDQDHKRNNENTSHRSNLCIITFFFIFAGLLIERSNQPAERENLTYGTNITPGHIVHA